MGQCGRTGEPALTRRLSSTLQVNTFISFVSPMVVISVLNTVIANKLTVMVRQAAEPGPVCTVGERLGVLGASIEPGRVQALRHGVRVLRTYLQQGAGGGQWMGDSACLSIPSLV